MANTHSIGKRLIKPIAVVAAAVMVVAVILCWPGSTLAATGDTVVTLQCESGVSQTFHLEKGSTATLGISYLSDASSTDMGTATVKFGPGVDGTAYVTGVKAGVASLIYGNIEGKVGAFKFQITDSQNISGYTLTESGQMHFNTIPATPSQQETRPSLVKNVVGQASTITWSSANPNVATVASNGAVTSRGAGMTIVTGSFTDKWGVARTITILVSVMPYAVL